MTTDEHTLEAAQAERAQLQQQLADLQKNLQVLAAECEKFRTLAEYIPDTEAYHVLVEHSLQGVVIYQDGHIVMSNRAAAEWLGYTPAELVALSAAEVLALFHPDDRARLEERVRQRFAGVPQLSPAVYRVLHKDGSVRWFELYGVGITYRGRPAVQATCIDITQRKVAEEALRESEQRYRFMADNVTDMIARHTPEGDYLYVSPACRLLLGYAPEEMVGRNAYDFLHPDDSSAIRVIHSNILEPGLSAIASYRLRRKDGSYAWFETTGKAIAHPDTGMVEELITVSRDITERRKMEEALRESQMRLQAIVDNAAVAIVTADASGRLTFASKQTAALTGYTREELLQLDYLDLTHPDDQKLLYALYQGLVEGRSDAYRLEKRYVRKDGSMVWGDAAVSALRNPQGAFQTGVVVVADITERKQAEEGLRQYQHIVSVTPDSIALVDRNYIYRIVNSAYLKRYQKAYDDIVGHSVADLLGSDVFEQVIKAKLDRCLAGETLSYRAWFEYSVEGRRFMDVTYAPYRDAQGEIIGALTSIRDVTDLKLAEEAVRKSQRFIEHIADTVPYMLYVFDLARGCNVYINRCISQFLGHSLEELQQMGLAFYASVIHPDDRPKLDEFSMQWQTAQDDQVFSKEYRLRNAAGEWRWIRSHEVVFARDEAGRPVQILGTALDITERKQAKEALRASEAKFRSIVEQSLDGIVLADENGCYIEWNQSAERITGLTRAAVLGRTGWDVLFQTTPEEQQTPDLYAQFRMAVQHMLRTGQTDKCNQLVEQPIQHADGTLLYVQGVHFAIPTERGFMLCGILRDTTARRMHEEDIRTLSQDLARRAQELEALNRDLEVFGYAIAHHLRSPLWTIRLCVRALYEDYADRLDSDGHELLRDIDETVEQMNMTIERLLNLSSLTYNDLIIESVNLSMLVRAIAAELCYREPDRQVSFDIAPGIVAIGDARLLRIALENLLENAWKYTGKQPAAMIQFGMLPETEPGQQVYFVRDNGIGFEQKDTPDPFGAFQRLHAASDFPGTGIGLALVRRIIHLHDGDIWAESAPGKGATFYFTLG